MRSHLYRLLKWPEVKQAAQERAVILVPVAAIEQHGYHLPVDMDNLAVETRYRGSRPLFPRPHFSNAGGPLWIQRAQYGLPRNHQYP